MVAMTLFPVETQISAPSCQVSPLKFHFNYLSNTQQPNLKDCKLSAKSAVLCKQTLHQLH